MSTSIGMSFIVRNMFGVTREYCGDVSVEDLLPSLLEWWDEHSHKDNKHESFSAQGWTTSPNEAYLRFLPLEAQGVVNGDAENIISVSPPVSFHAFSGDTWEWIMIEFPSESKWFFHFNRKLLTIPVNCDVDVDGTIEVTIREHDRDDQFIGTRIYRFAPDFQDEAGHWPWALLNPRVYVCLQRLESFISPSKEDENRNPLAELRRAPRPFRKFGYDITHELKEIHDILASSF